MSLPKNTATILLHLYPNSEPLKDWVVSENEGVISISNWNESLGSEPTKSELENASEDAEKTVKFKSIREQRNQLLSETDWMTFSDSPTMSDAWKKYRQDLRDLPASNSDPSKIVFPTKPE